jgi:hypothetical protein
MIKELTAAQAKEIALQGSAMLDIYLNQVFVLVEQTAKEGGFKLRYTMKDPGNIAYPLRERLLRLGYAVESSSAGHIDFVIEWR